MIAGSEIFHGAQHGKQRCLQDIHLLNFLDGNDADPDCRIAVGEQLEEFYPPAMGKLLGIAKKRRVAAGGQYDTGGDDRTGQRTAACFIRAGDTAKASSGKTLLVVEIRLGRHIEIE
jgi:hypothetical protein